MNNATEQILAFRQKPEYRDRLAELMKDPVLQMAIEIIKGAAVPRPPTDQETTSLADIVFGRRYLLMSGVNQGFDKLELLTKAITVNEAAVAIQMSKAYDHTLPAELREQPESPKC